jgi:hypothetical protein
MSSNRLRRSFLPIAQLSFLLVFLSGCLAPEVIRKSEIASRPVAGLHELVSDASPWFHMAAYSEQAPPLYLGSTPREIELGLAPANRGDVLLPGDLKVLGERQMGTIHRGLVQTGRVKAGEAVELEGWLTVDDAGRWTWAFARWRAHDPSAMDRGLRLRWRWLDPGALPGPEPAVPPILPVSLRAGEKADHALIFNDFLELAGLYDKPAFGNCLWSTEGEDAELPSGTSAWMPPVRMSETRQKGAPAPVCRVLNQPMRLNGKAATWRIRSDGTRAVWPEGIRWQADESQPVRRAGGPSGIKWPEGFREAYRQDVLAIDGEVPAVFPVSKRQVVFKRKNSADPQNQLPLLIEYLEERYHALGLKTFRQEFSWRGIPQVNLVAVIEGSEPGKTNRPVLLADHIDTAYCEDVYAANGQRLSAPGADDNVSATAALLRAAEILRDSRPRQDIWLTHFTGEEFPADCMGARAFLGHLLRQKKDITGLVLMDMIGWREAGDPVFQISQGTGPAAGEMAAVALDASEAIAAGGSLVLKPVLRLRRDERSYLYNTDGLPFSDAGYPVILFNEHINRLHNLNRIGYHHTLDASGLMDWDYAAAIARMAIETAARLAGAFGAPLH